MSSIKALPVNGQINTNQDVIAFLRSMADQLEKDEVGAIKSALVLIEHSGTVDTFVSGTAGQDNARVIGVLEIAKQEFVARMFDGN